MRKIAVLGAGTMGSGIAQLCAEHGYDVLLFDKDIIACEKAVQKISMFLQRSTRPKKTEEEIKTILENISITSDYNDLAVAEYVIEAVTEKMEIKKEVLKKLEEVCSGEVVFATNTSGLNITEMSSVLKNPGRLIGTHYFYPPPKNQLIEVIRGFHTSGTTEKIAKEFVESLGKRAIFVKKEAPLFVFNRIIVPMINEAILVLEEGICEKEEIDDALMIAGGHPVGPLSLADLIGLDTLLHVMDTIFVETGDPKYRPASLLKQMVRAGLLGKKSGKGFYEYTQVERAVSQVK